MSSIINPEEMDDRIRRDTAVAVGREVMRKILKQDVSPVHPLVEPVTIDLGRRPVEPDEENDDLVFLTNTRFASIKLPAGFEDASKHQTLISMWDTRRSLYRKLPLGMRSLIPLVKIDSVRLNAQSYGDRLADVTVLTSDRLAVAPACPDEDMIAFVRSMSLVTRALGIDRDLAERNYTLPARLLPEPA